MAFDLSILGVEENIPKVSFTEYSGLLQAPPKFGKTTFATLYDNCILLACEPGYKAKKINFRKITCWDDFCDFVSLLEDNREKIGDDVKTIVIDTIDRLYPYVQEYTVRKYNRRKSIDAPRAETIGDIPHGKGWSSADEEFLNKITKVLDLGFTFLFITHNKVKTIKPKNTPEYDVYTPTMSDRCAAIIYPLVDFIINGERTVVVEDGQKVNKRQLVLRGNEMVNGGSRVGEINESILFDTEQEAMDRFRESFKNAIQKELEKSGDKVNIAKLEKEQKKEKDNKIKEELLKRDLPKTIKQIIELMKVKRDEGKIDNAYIKDLLMKYELDSPNDITDIQIAKNILKELEEVKCERD
jgi:hypothetical protein